MRFVAALSFVVVTLTVGCTQPVGDEEGKIGSNEQAEISLSRQTVEDPLGNSDPLFDITNAEDCEAAGGTWGPADPNTGRPGVCSPATSSDGSRTWTATGSETSADAAVKTTAFLQRVVTMLDQCAGAQSAQVGKWINLAIGRANANHLYVDAAKRFATGARLATTDTAFISALRQMSAVRAAAKRAVAAGC